MPAEWEPHSATWLAWPHYEKDWPGKFEPIPWVFAEIVRSLARHERVEIIVRDAAAERHAKKILNLADALSARVGFHHWLTDRIWLRDSGCIFVKRGAGAPDSVQLNSRRRRSAQMSREKRELSRATKDRRKRGALEPNDLAAMKWRFNAWAKYSNWHQDEKIGTLMAGSAAVPEIRPVHGEHRIVLEGGSIDVNGRGSLLTTEECLLSTTQQRNPGMMRRDYEKAFRQYLGVSNVIWLGKGITGDDTHGHVDDLARFVSPETIVTMVEPNRHDPNHVPLRENLRRLKSARDQDGKRFHVVEIPMPQPVVFEGRRMPASYANFYIANGVVLVPVFNRSNDRVALNALARLFPDRDMVPIYSGDFIWGFGAMHCMTQQQPA
jgi:agmatine deiminase